MARHQRGGFLKQCCRLIDARAVKEHRAEEPVSAHKMLVVRDALPKLDGGAKCRFGPIQIARLHKGTAKSEESGHTHDGVAALFAGPHNLLRHAHRPLGLAEVAQQLRPEARGRRPTPEIATLPVRRGRLLVGGAGRAVVSEGVLRVESEPGMR